MICRSHHIVVRLALGAVLGLFLSVPMINAQQEFLQLIDVNSADFPTVTANIFAFDESGQSLQGLVAEDILLSDNGADIAGLRLECPGDVEAQALSSVLAIDASLSMDGARWQIARHGAEHWIDRALDGSSDCALSIFDRQSYVLQDFSSDQGRLTAALDRHTTGSGTDFNAALLDGPAAALRLAGRAGHRPIVILLTDGAGPLDLTRVRDFALSNGLTIYCLGLFSVLQKDLKTLAMETGGYCFDRIASLEEIRRYYSLVLYLARGGKPCRLSWQAVGDCDTEREVGLEVVNSELSLTFQYQPSPANRARAEIAPSSIEFGAVIPDGRRVEREVIITARDAALRLDGFQSSDARFHIERPDPPAGNILQPNESEHVVLVYTPPDSASVVAQISLQSDSCADTLFHVAGGYQNASFGPRQLRLLSPAAGDTLLAGQELAITWDGVLPDEKIQIDYRAGPAADWELVTDAASNLRYDWQAPISAGPTTELRLRYFAEGNVDASHAEIHPFAQRSVTGQARGVDFIPGDSLAVITGGTSDALNPVQIWNYRSDSIIRSFDLSGAGRLTAQDVSTSGHYLALGGIDGVVYLFRLSEGELIRRFTIGNTPVTYVAISADERYLAASYANAGIGAVIWDLQTLEQVHDITDHIGTIHTIRFSADVTSFLTTGADRSTRIWSLESAVTFRTLNSHSDEVLCAAFSPDGSLVATGSRDGSLELWQVAPWRRIRKLSLNDLPVLDLDFSPDGKMLLAAYQFGSAEVWRLSSFESARTLVGHRNDVNFGRFHPDGILAASSDKDGRVIVWRLDVARRELSQTSRVLRHLQPALTLVERVAMGDVILNRQRDSIVNSCLCNRSDAPVLVRSLTLQQDEEGEFELPTRAVPLSLRPGICHPLEIRFRPSRTGERRALLVAETANEVLHCRLIGNGLPAGMSGVSILDFGMVAPGERKDSSISLQVENNSGEPVLLSGLRLRGPDSEQFSIAAGNEVRILADGDTHELTLSFAPEEVGRTSGRLEVVQDFGGGRAKIAAEVLLHGEGACDLALPPQGAFTIALPEVEVHEQDRLLLNLTVTPAAGMQSAFDQGLRDFEARIRFNRTILVPVGATPAGSVDGDDRVIDIRGSITDVDPVAIRLEFIAVFGNAESTELQIESFAFTGCPVSKLLRHGKVTISDICRAGGLRLFNSSGSLALLRSQPNPARDATIIQFALRENGLTQLTLYDALGREVRRLVDAILSKGPYELRLATQDLPAGRYLYVLRTPTAVIHEHLVVMQ